MEILNEIDGIEISRLLADLVSIPSYESEQKIADYIARRLEKIGADYEFTEVAPGRRNLVASTGAGEKALIFNTHTDTVPPGNSENWKHPPLRLTRDGGELFGLGACDAKGSLASMITAFEMLACNASLLNGRLILQAVCCEETRGRGTLAETMRGITADAAIIGEPTELVPMIGHKGGIVMKITIFGKAAHASSPHEGINAISKMTELIKALNALAEDISTRRDPLFGGASLAITQIQGGQASNVVPDECTITLDRRLIPGETLDDAREEILAVIDKQKTLDPDLIISTKQTIGIKPCRTPLDEPIVKVVKDSVNKVKGIRQEVSGFSACCDMWCLVEGAGIPTVILGPGETSIAHKANESITVEELYEAAKIYTAIALNWLE